MAAQEAAQAVVLVVQESFLIAADICGELEAHGYCALPAGSAADARVILASTTVIAAVIGLRLADGMTGETLISDLTGQGVPVVVCTAFNLNSRPIALPPSLHRIVGKPAEPGEIASAVKDLLAKP